MNLFQYMYPFVEHKLPVDNNQSNLHSNILYYPGKNPLILYKADLPRFYYDLKPAWVYLNFLLLLKMYMFFPNLLPPEGSVFDDCFYNFGSNYLWHGVDHRGGQIRILPSTLTYFLFITPVHQAYPVNHPGPDQFLKTSLSFLWLYLSNLKHRIEPPGYCMHIYFLD